MQVKPNKSERMLSYFLTTLVLLGGVSAQDDIVTVDELIVSQYSGRFYQTHANLVVNQTIERNSLCVTADYTQVDDARVLVYNSGRKNTPDGRISEIFGEAYVLDESEPGKLIVDLESDIVNPPPGDYWIIRLGPVIDGQYQFSVVTTPERRQLYVLVRDVPQFRELYQEEVLEWLANNGFDTPDKEPLETYHENDCVYSVPPSH